MAHLETLEPERVSVRFDLHPVTAAAFGLILLQTIVRTVVSLGSYFWQDDFFHLWLSREQGWSLDLLVRDHNDHLEIVPNALFWVLTLGESRSFAAAAVILVLLQLVASVLMWRVLDRLFGPRPLILVALTVYLFTPLTLVTATWLAAGLEAITYQIAMLGCLLGWLRLDRDGSRRWSWAATGALAAYAFGLASWEKALLVLPTVLAVLLVVAWRDLPVRQRLLRLRGHATVLVAHVVLAAAYVVLYLQVTDGSERAGTAAAPYLRSGGTLLLQVFVPGVLGGPWSTSGAENTLYPRPPVLVVVLCLAVAAGVVAASVALGGRAALAPWGFVLAYLAGDVVLMWWGRGAYLDLVSRDPRYLVDAVPVVALGLAAAYAVPERAGAAAGLPALAGDGERRRLVATVAVAALLVSSLLTTLLLAPVAQRSYARNYVEATARIFDLDSSRSVVDVDPPGEVSTLVSQQQLMTAVGFDAPFNQPGTELFLLDSIAQLRPVQVIEPVLDRVGPLPDCGWRVGRGAKVLGYLPERPTHGYTLRIGYVTGAPAELNVRIGEDRQTVALQPGLGYAWFVVEGMHGPVEVWTRKTGSGICVSDVLAGQPWPVG